MNITKNVITDLWPLYADGTASADTRALVEEFLAQDPKLSETLQQAARDAGAALPLPDVEPEQEVIMANKIRRRVRIMRWMLLLAMIFTCQAFGRIVADTSWDVSPRNFIIVSTIAGVFWVAFIVALLRIGRVRI